MDTSVLLTTDHKSIKKHQNFIFVNNGSRAYYDDRYIFDAISHLINGFNIIPNVEF